MHEAYAHGEDSRTPPPSFSTQKNRCPSEYAHSSLRSLIYIYIYIYNFFYINYGSFSTYRTPIYLLATVFVYLEKLFPLTTAEPTRTVELKN